MSIPLVKAALFIVKLFSPLRSIYIRPLKIKGPLQDAICINTNSHLETSWWNTIYSNFCRFYKNKTVDDSVTIQTS